MNNYSHASLGDVTYTWDTNKNKKSESISGTMSGYGFTQSGTVYDDEDRLTGYARSNSSLTQSWESGSKSMLRFSVKTWFSICAVVCGSLIVVMQFWIIADGVPRDSHMLKVVVISVLEAANDNGGLMPKDWNDLAAVLSKRHGYSSERIDALRNRISVDFEQLQSCNGFKSEAITATYTNGFHPKDYVDGIASRLFVRTETKEKQRRQEGKSEGK